MSAPTQVAILFLTLVLCGASSAAEHFVVPPGAYRITVFGEKTSERDARNIVDSTGLLFIADAPQTREALPPAPSDDFRRRFGWWYEEDSKLEFSVCVSLIPGDLRDGAYLLAPIVLSEVVKKKDKATIPLYGSPDSHMDLVVAKITKTGFVGTIDGYWGFDGGGITTQRVVAERVLTGAYLMTDCLEHGQQAWIANEQESSAWTVFSSWAYYKFHAKNENKK